MSQRTLKLGLFLQVSNRAIQLFWLLLVLGMCTTMIAISVPEMPLRLTTTTKIIWNFEELSHLLPTPALTLCAVQMGDRWNLARAMLNQARK